MQKQTKREKYSNFDRGLKQLDSKHVQDVSDVAEDGCEHSRTPSAFATLSTDKR